MGGNGSPEIPGYALTSLLGEGSMGTTFLGRSEKGGNLCVVKVADIEKSGISEKLFLREIETLSYLDHPNVLKVLAFGRAQSILYLVTEYIAGGTLADRLTCGKILPVKRILEIAIAICGALVFLHQRHIVHRDIKPSNIFLSPESTAKLGDFGLAKNVTTAGKSGITLPGLGRGTLEYISLEQLENAVYADWRSDQYSFGATFYHVLTGRLPHQGSTMTDLLTSLLRTEPIRPSKLRPEINRDLESIILKAMAKRADQRYPSPEILFQELNRITHTP